MRWPWRAPLGDFICFAMSEGAWSRAPATAMAMRSRIACFTRHTRSSSNASKLVPAQALAKRAGAKPEIPCQPASWDENATTHGRCERLLQAWLVPR
ncbi:MAG: hypothetical protein JWN13_3480 [Betaproteobacteria bacterium]|jgi:hypothetical protein|nr:hypothetical protein [Betaproteobacteria bacterium]